MSDFKQFSSTMDHLGVIATMYDDIGISDIIDEFTGIHHNQTVSCGQATKAMILNMLAIFMRPLYLVSKYLHGKPVHRLIAENLQAKDFTDDVLGRTLDKLYEHDLEAIFLKISSVAFNKYSDFQSPYLHGDTSLMKVHGEYGTNDFDNAIEITYGYSKNKDKGLKQFLISMITCDNLPVFIGTLSGNESDKVSLREMTKKYGESIMSSFDESKTFVFDSAFYSASTVRSCNFPWITILVN